jgi:hypothetical protein
MHVILEISPHIWLLTASFEPELYDILKGFRNLCKDFSYIIWLKLVQLL